MQYPLLLLNLVCTLFPLLSKNKEKGLKWSFIVLFVFLALRYDFGNDYPAYYRMFNYATFEQALDSKIEYGYALLTSLFKPFGFFTFIILWSAIYCSALYQTIRRYIPSEYYWLIMLSLISNADLVFYGASAIRQTLAFSVILFSLPYLEAKKPLYYLGMVVPASLFHMSALTFVVLYPLMYLNLKNKTFIIIFGLLALAVMTVLQSQFSALVNTLAANNFEKYVERYGDSKQTIEGGFIGIIIRVIFLLLFLWSMSFENNKIKSIFFILGIVCIAIFSMRDFVSLQRFTLYYGYMMAFSFAYSLKFIKQHVGQLYYPVLAIILIWDINMAIVFASQTNSLFEYHTIFEYNTHFIPR